MNFDKRNGAILIITLWIMAILTVLSVGIASRMGLELKLTGYYRDNMKALYLAKAAIQMAVAEKVKNDDNPEADFLGEGWANDEELFYNYSLGNTENSFYTIRYDYKENKEDEGMELYGMMDESSKININNIVKDDDTVDADIKTQLVNLLKNVCELEDFEAEKLANNLIDWIDENKQRTKQSPEEPDDENALYEDTGADNYCKNRKLDAIEELLLIKGFDDAAILYGGSGEEGTKNKKYGIINYITIYTEDKKVNINTASLEVLEALGFRTVRAAEIINYRRNAESMEEESFENKPIETGELNTNFFKTNVFKEPLAEGEEDEINKILSNYISTVSNTFRIYATGNANGVEKRINCVVTIKSGEEPKFKYWSEE